ncbi:L-proline---[L-prolyl-carrier protein] ligase [Methylomarinovum tepidoasis]|uniref:L-proline---[L-prolyl-carrier protein] ligase n=1 Tax=Methylomarinovum tepidoasis TaxID=2840183 RepID=A0AAU9D0L8_9GAMM|nr:AMP-binding protein [Methylomarinovum sp. IN45]BCX89879.1 L-proline---[L-prolyl-carrier protein] ligase [Methylomarinovum sp. IN45]
MNSFPADASPLLGPFLTQVAARPNAPALREGDLTLSYAGLARRAAAIAIELDRLRLPPGTPVAIDLPRGIDAACAVLGILAAGHPYLPLDPKAPPTRRQAIVTDARAGAVITWENRTELPTVLPRGEHDAPLVGPSQVETLAAILYTSGSTGRPKGVALSHGAIAAFADWARDLVRLTPADRIATIAPLAFDLSTFDLFSVLGAGSCADFLPDGLTMAPRRFTQWLAARGITGFYTIPSLLGFWACKGGLAEIPLPALRFLLFAGEPFPTPALRRLADALPRAALFNLYGPTETNVCCCWPVDRDRLDSEDPIPIGRPACGDELKVDPGSGELKVRGPTLLSGYWREGHLRPALDREGWYATGDRVEVNEYGEYVWRGRLDRMVKIAGHRVEPAEVEAALLALPGVTAAAVVACDTPDAPRLHAAVVGDGTPAALRLALRARLPGYMVPARITRLPALPRLANGKPDLEALRRQLTGKRKAGREDRPREGEEV